MSEERQGAVRVTRSARPVHPARPCQNCGDRTYGEFCPSCGQRKVDAQVSLPLMVKEVLEDEFLLNRRLPYTIFALLFRPGFLTAEVLQGRVARYVRPFRLYLMSSVVFFLLLSFVSLRAVERLEFGEGSTRPDSAARASGLVALDSAIADIDRQLEGADPTAAAAIALGGVRGGLERERERLLRADSAGTDSLAADRDAPRGPEAPPAGSTGAQREDADEDDGWLDVREVNTGSARVDSVIQVRLDRWSEMEQREVVAELARTFMGWVPTIMFLVLPVFAAMLKLIYVRQRRYYAEHLIFVLHAHAFVFVIFSLMLLTRSWIGGFPTLLLVSWVLVYIYLAMRRVYGQSRFKTFIKYWTLGWMYFWILVIAIPLFFIAGVFLLPA